MIVSAIVALSPVSVKPSSSAASPSIVAVIVPVVAACRALIAVTLSSVTLAAVLFTVMLTSASLFLTATISAWTAVPLVTEPNASTIPAALKSTVPTFVASVIVLPCEAVVVESLTTIVYA